MGKVCFVCFSTDKTGRLTSLYAYDEENKKTYLDKIKFVVGEISVNLCISFLNKNSKIL